MAWYRSGTLSVTNGSTSVTGAGTSWIAGAGIGEALYAPDGRIYEIANISSNTSLTLATAYLGTTQSAQSYTIIPSQSYIRDLAADAAALISQYAGIASGAGAGKFTDGTVSTPGIAFASDVDTGIYHPATNTLGIAAGGINQMQVSTAGVNIGTLSANPVISAGTANGVLYLNGGKVASSGSALTFDGTTLANLGVGDRARFGTSLRSVYIAGDSGGVSLFDGAGQTGNGIYLSALGSYVAGYVGSSEQMRLTSTGLGIGTSSPSAKLTIRSPHSVATATTFTGGLLVHDEPSGTRSHLGAGVAYNGGDEHAWLQANSTTGVETLALNPAGGAIRFGADAATLDASGNFLLGATSSTGAGAKRLQIGSEAYATAQILLKTSGGHAAMYSSGAAVYQSWTPGGFLAIGVAPADGSTFTERVRIDVGGNLLVGTTSVPGTASTSGVAIQDVDGTIGRIQLGKTFSGNTDGIPFFYNTTYVGGIQYSDTVVAYNTSSDARLKENIQPATDSAALIDAIQVRQYNWKSDGSHQRYGMVAQELDEVFPEAVSKPADPEQMMGVDYSKLVPLLLKEVQSLRARVAQLESN